MDVEPDLNADQNPNRNRNVHEATRKAYHPKLDGAYLSILLVNGVI
jgi:shikimate kinase